MPASTIEDKLKTVLKLRSATVNDIPVLMHMARALAEQQGLTPLMTETAGRVIRGCNKGVIELVDLKWRP
jgi:hypothetical protein